MLDQARSVPFPDARQLAMRVRRVDDAAQLDALVPAWQALVDEEDHPGAPFRGPAWLRTWWRHFGDGRRALRTYVVERDGALVGLLPAYRAGGRLRLLGDNIVGSDHLGAIARAEERDGVIAALAAALAAGEGDLALDGLDDDDPLLPALAAAAPAARVDVETLLPSPWLDVRAAGEFGAWLDTLPSGAGAQLRRRRRWLERQPGFRLDVIRDPIGLAAGLDALWQLHEQRWAPAGGSDAVDSPAIIDFHRDAGAALARRGQARLFLLHVDGAPRAGLYGFRWGTRFAYYQSGSDPAWRQRSVGTVVLGAAIEEAFRDRVTEFDFLRGDESYKGTFASARRRLVRVRVAVGVRPRARRAFERGAATARAGLRDALPASVVEWIRRTRRRLVSRGLP